MTMQPTKEQQEVINLLENLIRVASRNKVHIIGFAYSQGDPQLLVSISNGADPTDIRLYEQLIKLRKREVDRGGKIEENLVGEVN